MSYKPKPSQTYKVQRPSPVKPLFRLSAKQLTRMQAKYGRSAPSATVANVADVANFLARYISGNQNVMLAFGGQRSGFSVGPYQTPSGKQYYIVRAPAWHLYDIHVKGFDRYRIYRYGIFHEACHIRYTPEKLYRVADYVAKDIVNIIEDRRIEELGVKEWPGYLPERIYHIAYGYALRPKVDSLMDRNMRLIEAFMQRFLTGRVKGKLPPDEKKLIEEANKMAEECLKRLENETRNWRIEDDIIDTAYEIKKLLNLDKPYQSLSDSGSPWEDTFTPEYSQTSPMTPEDVETGIEEYYREKKRECKKARPGEKKSPTEITEEDLEQSRKGAADVQEEYRKIQKQEKIDPTLTGWAPIASQGPVSEYRDAKFISAMNTYLQSWREGYIRIVGKSGASFSVKEYIRHKDEPFVTRLKQSVKGKKLLILADFSGSMHSREDDYKRALISSLEVLNSIGCNIALFAFATDPAMGDGFYRVKTFEEPKLTNTHLAKLAGLLAQYNSTPTASAYMALEKYVVKHKPEVFVTITDGEPDVPLETAEMVRKLKRFTRMVAYGISSPHVPRDKMEENLKAYGYHKSFAVDNVHEIPPKLVSLLIT